MSGFNKEVIVVVFIAITLIITITISVKSSASKSNAITGNIMNIFTPIQVGTNKIFRGFSENVSGILNYKSNLEKVETLKNENNKLRKKIISINLKKDELKNLEELKKSLNFSAEMYNQSFVSADVVSKNDGNWYSIFVVAAGKKEGVKVNSIVVSGEGLVGRVFEVSDKYCKVVAILNNQSAVSFEILRKPEYTGVLSQNLSIDSNENFEGYLKGYLFDIKYEVVPGDVIITSGIGMYPKGIPVGEVEKVIEDKNSLLKIYKGKTIR